MYIEGQDDRSWLILKRNSRNKFGKGKFLRAPFSSASMAKNAWNGVIEPREGKKKLGTPSSIGFRGPSPAIR
mgnify:CR=1 FL=1